MKWCHHDLVVAHRYSCKELAGTCNRGTDVNFCMYQSARVKYSDVVAVVGCEYGNIAHSCRTSVRCNMLCAQCNIW